MLETGTTFSGYRVDGILGQGGMGVVYEATQLSLHRTIALKLLAAHLSDDIAFRERFRREGQIQAAIDHPNIITVYEAGESEHGLFIAMRLVRGPNLKDMIIGRELDAGRTLRVLRPVADALDSAHDAGLIHRDIKPQNILVGARDHPFLADFGLTKGAGEKSLTRTGQFVGTLDYISPEQIEGGRATAQSDVYSLTGVLYECLTGVVPFPKPSEAAVLYAHMSDPRPRVTDERPELPSGLDDVIMQGMSTDPTERFQSGSELLDEAERTFTRRVRAAITPPGPIDAPQETGIREVEGAVETHEAPARKPEPVIPTSTAAGAGAAATETVTGGAAEAASPGATRPAEKAPTAVPEPPSAETRAAGAATPTRVARPDVAQPERETARRDGVSATSARAPAVIPGWGFALAGLGLLGVIVLGFLLGHSGGGGNAKGTPANTASAGALEVGFSNTWQRAQKQEAIPGLQFRSPISRVPNSAKGGESLTVGQVDASGASLLPADFIRRLPGGSPPPRNDKVKLGDLEAYRYTNLKPSGFAKALTLYTAPTSAGVATVACAANPNALPGLASDCEAVATTLKLTAGKSYSLGPDESYAAALDKNIGSLNARVRTGKSQLAKAKTAGAQSRSAGTLAAAYAATAGNLGKLAVGPAVRDIHLDVVGSLRNTESAYRDLSRAAARNRRSAYNSARKRVTQGERNVTASLARLKQLGYNVK